MSLHLLYLKVFYTAHVYIRATYITFVMPNAAIQNRTLKLKVLSKNKQVGLPQPKSFCAAKETVNKVERKCMEWEKKFANHISDKGLLIKKDKEFMRSSHRGAVVKESD